MYSWSSRGECAIITLLMIGLPIAGYVKTIAFDTDEGTSVNLDVSPDGRTVVFDLLGGLYTLPVAGGEAKPLLSGSAWNRAPRYSPEGAEVAFISDRGNGDQVWLLEVSTGRVRALTSVANAEVTGTPEWLPKGEEIAYGLSTAKEVRLSVVSAKDGASRLLMPGWRSITGEKWAGAYSVVFMPDGREGFFSLSMLSESSTRKPWRTVLCTLDVQSGKITVLTQQIGERDEFKPQLSRSGRMLAYIRSDASRNSELRVRDLVSGLDRSLAALPETDEPKTEGNFLGGDERPAYAFTPDDQSLIIWYAGKIHRVSVGDGSVAEVPFRVHTLHEVAEPARAHYRIPNGPLRVRAVRWPTISPDGRQLAFSAVGSLWTQDLPDGKPRRLTHSDDFEFMPAYSPDGRQLAYIVLAHSPDQIMGPARLLIRKLDGGTTHELGMGGVSSYAPSWSRDSSKIALIEQTDDSETARAQFGWIDLNSGLFHSVAAAAPVSRPDGRYSLAQHVSFASDGKSLFYQPGGSADRRATSLHRVDLDGRNDQELVTAERNDVYGIFPSPDGGKALVVAWDLQAYLVQLPKDGSHPATLSLSGRNVRLLSQEGALYPTWTSNRSAIYAWSGRIFRYGLGQAAPKLLAKVNLEVPRRGGRGVVAFVDARLITMDGAQGVGRVIEHGTLLIQDGRITAVGLANSVSIPRDATIVKATGLTLMPGFIDSHFHGLGTRLPSSQLSIPVGPEMYTPSPLAYGITTTWEAMGTQDDGNLAEIELREAGRLVGQRWFTAGGIMNREDRVAYGTFDDVFARVRRKKALGAEQCLKSRQEHVRRAVQWYVEAARRADLCLVVHTQTTPELLAWAGDGAMVDHPTLPAPSYRDVLQYLSQTGVIWTPHALIALSTRSMEDLAVRSWLDELQARGHSAELDKYKRWSKRNLILGSTHFDALEKLPGVPYGQTAAAREAKVVAAFAAAGGKVTVSTDGAIGLEYHFELWGFHRAGMPTVEALRAATMNAAEKLGLQDDLGSLAPGKLADLIVLSANPLEDIENTLSLKYTVLGGVIYDSNTLEVVAPRGTFQALSVGDVDHLPPNAKRNDWRGPRAGRADITRGPPA